MCFHNSLSTDSQKLENRYKAKMLPLSEFQAVYHASAFTFPPWPVITNDFKNVIQMFTWGLIPFYTKNSQAAQEIKAMTLNARIETLHSKKSFSIAAKTKRCLIPSTGFFEWQHVNNQKIPWFIRSDREEIFSMAGLWDTWTDPFSGIQHNTFTIVTTEAKGIMAEIHNTKKRMPLILHRENELAWLQSDIHSQQMKFHKTELSFKAHTVSPLIAKKGVNTNVREVQENHIYTINGTLF